MSGVLSTDYSSKVDGRNIEFTAKNLLVAYEALIASGSVSLESFGITSHAGDVYFLMNHLREYNMLSPAMLAVFQKYDNTWFSLTKKDLQDSLSGGTTQDILSYQLSENLSTLSIDEIK